MTIKLLFLLLEVQAVGLMSRSQDLALIAAEEVGRLIAEKGGILLTGGKDGIMEAASRGANLAGGIVVGLLPSNFKSEANPYVTVPLPTGLDFVRNYLTIRAADVVIMILWIKRNPT